MASAIRRRRSAPDAAAEGLADCCGAVRASGVMNKHPSAHHERRHARETSAEGASTWAAQPATGEWSTATNWDPADVPTSTAAFGASSRTGIVFSANSSATVGDIVFAAGAPSYTFTFSSPAPDTPALTITGSGL